MESTASPVVTSDLPTEPQDGDTLAVTVDETGNVLELIYSNVDGIYVRDGNTWELADTDIEQPTIDDQEWLDVTPEFISVYDEMQNTQDSITRDDAVPYGAVPA